MNRGQEFWGKKKIDLPNYISDNPLQYFLFFIIVSQSLEGHHETLPSVALDGVDTLQAIITF